MLEAADENAVDLKLRVEHEYIRTLTAFEAPGMACDSGALGWCAGAPSLPDALGPLAELPLTLALPVVASDICRVYARFPCIRTGVRGTTLT